MNLNEIAQPPSQPQSVTLSEIIASVSLKDFVLNLSQDNKRKAEIIEQLKEKIEELNEQLSEKEQTIHMMRDKEFDYIKEIQHLKKKLEEEGGWQIVMPP